MTTTTLTLAAFLEARLAEDEAEALAVERDVTAEFGHAMSVLSSALAAAGSGYMEYPVLTIDPTRVLAEVAAKRAVLAACEDERQRKDIYNRGYDEGLLTTDGDRRSRLSSNARWAGLDLAVRFMVQVYSDHADFRPEWLPENW